MFIDFLKKKDALAFLETALILPIFLTLVMGIIEFSIIFSIRSGLEEVSRSFARITATKAGGLRLIGNQNITYRQAITNFMHERATNIVLRPENLRFCIEVRPDLTGILDVAINTMTTCVQFNQSRNTRPNAFFNINDQEYGVVKLSYTHEYITPIGRLVTALGNNLTFNTVTYFRKE